MNQDRTSYIREQSSDTVIWILGVKGETKEIVKECILEQGLKSFLLHHNLLELEPDEHEKIEVLKRVIQTFDGDIETMNFGDLDEGC
jgi:hypothetical protein